LDTIIKLSKKKKIYLSPIEARVWACQLWINPSGIAWLSNGDTKELEISQVFIDGKIAAPMLTLADVRASAPETAAWVQSGPLLYVRLNLSAADDQLYPSAGEWFFTLKSAGVTLAFTDGEFYYGAMGTEYKAALTSEYTQKLTGERNSYEKIKFENIPVSFLRRVIGDGIDYIGQPITVFDKTGVKLGMWLVRNAAYNMESATLLCKDIRAMFSDKIINQKFDRDEYRNSAGHYIMSEETAKKYKGDAIGYCVGVPGVVVNDYAFTTGSGVYAAGYRFINIHYISVSERLPNGVSVATTLAALPARAVNPPPTGSGEPDYGGSGRKTRATGLFNADQGRNIDTPLGILKYLIDRYSTIQFINTWFNIGEIESELALIESGKCGIFFENPEDLYNGIGKVQAGGVYGFQLSVYNGLITCRVDYPGRALWGSIPYTDIANIASLLVDADSENYVSNLTVEYSRDYEQKTAMEYADHMTEMKTLDIRTVSKTRRVESLLRYEEHARIRYNAEAAASLGVCPVIENIEVRKFEKYKTLRPYDVVSIDFQGLSDRKIWKISAVSINYKQEKITISVYAKPDSV
jgi:hypothetical protein